MLTTSEFIQLFSYSLKHSSTGLTGSRHPGREPAAEENDKAADNSRLKPGLGTSLAGRAACSVMTDGGRDDKEVILKR